MRARRSTPPASRCRPRARLIPAVERHEVVSAIATDSIAVRRSVDGRRARRRSSKPARSGTSFTPTSAITHTTRQRRPPRGTPANASARSTRKAGGRRCTVTPPAAPCSRSGSPVDDHAHDRHADRRADRARELGQRRRGAHLRAPHRVLHGEDEDLHDRADADAATTMLRAASRFVVWTFIRQSRIIPVARMSGPTTTFVAIPTCPRDPLARDDRRRHRAEHRAA